MQIHEDKFMVVHMGSVPPMQSVDHDGTIGPYQLRVLAREHAKRFPAGVMTEDDVLSVWRRHPEYAPGGIYADYDPIAGMPQYSRVDWSRVIAAVFGVVALIIIGVAFCSRPASAASMEYCARYSREYVHIYAADLPALDRVDERVDFVLRRIYSWCLNQDDDPVLVLGADAMFVGALVASIHQAPEPTVEDLPTLITQAGLSVMSVPVDEVGKYGASGAAPHTAVWNKWCKANYRTFNSRTGTVRRNGHHKRTLCPG